MQKTPSTNPAKQGKVCCYFGKQNKLKKNQVLMLFVQFFMHCKESGKRKGGRGGENKAEVLFVCLFPEDSIKRKTNAQISLCTLLG
jgi:hypothetical protein